ncbi:MULTISPECIES: response regulator [Amycolatopsis]|uniref:response regulator n=1 Tax=Amycolatopsis sp. CFH S0740 TaxID=1644111 RepID=UPI00106F99F6
MNDQIRVVVADDQALLRGSFRLLLDSEPDFTVIGEAATGAEAVELAVTEEPDVVLMDVRMPVMDGIEATRLIGELRLGHGLTGMRERVAATLRCADE